MDAKAQIQPKNLSNGWEEREEIRRWVKMPDERNGRNNDEATTNYIWKARGNPKTGMRIIQIRI